MAAENINYFGNQFSTVYDTFLDTIGPRFANARQAQHPQLAQMEDELYRLGEHLEQHLDPRLEFPNAPNAQFFPEIQSVYQTLQDVKNTMDQAVQNHDPNLPIMQEQLRDRLDNLEVFVSENFLRNFLGRGEDLVMHGGKARKSKKPRKSRKSRKTKRKTRTTRRR